MHVIGTDRVRFISLQKNGSTSLRNILREHTDIKGWYTSDIDKDHKFPYIEEDLLNENIYFIYPLRETKARKRSSVLQTIDSKYGMIDDIEELTATIKKYLQSFIKYTHALDYWHCPFFRAFIGDMFRKQRQIKAKVVFIDAESLSSNALQSFCSKIDNKWQNILIPHEYKATQDPFKVKVMSIISELSKDNTSGVLDWFDDSNWDDKEHNSLLNVIRNSEYFYTTSKLLEFK